jgi:PIN domain nuclease of toxin-antitoxin system
MRALLDTHTFLWWVINSPQISPTAHTVIADPSSQILFSAASGWEIAIKAQLRKLQVPQPHGLVPTGTDFRIEQLLREALQARDRTT